ncbi:MAG: hypothetical protein HY600_07005, partial [Candidatus Omnitrophica bacterium]|nr:hypothetical protein [Candidatus Omnitrophota bacterium]
MSEQLDLEIPEAGEGVAGILVPVQSRRFRPWLRGIASTLIVTFVLTQTDLPLLAAPIVPGQQNYANWSNFANYESFKKWQQQQSEELQRRQNLELNRLTAAFNATFDVTRRTLDTVATRAQTTQTVFSAAMQSHSNIQELASNLAPPGREFSYVKYPDGMTIYFRGGLASRVVGEWITDSFGNRFLQDTVDMQYDSKRLLRSYRSFQRTEQGLLMREVRWQGSYTPDSVYYATKTTKAVRRVLHETIETTEYGPVTADDIARVRTQVQQTLDRFAAHQASEAERQWALTRQREMDSGKLVVGTPQANTSTLVRTNSRWERDQATAWTQQMTDSSGTTTSTVEVTYANEVITHHRERGTRTTTITADDLAYYQAWAAGVLDQPQADPTEVAAARRLQQQIADGTLAVGQQASVEFTMVRDQYTYDEKKKNPLTWREVSTSSAAPGASTTSQFKVQYDGKGQTFDSEVRQTEEGVTSAADIQRLWEAVQAVETRTLEATMAEQQWAAQMRARLAQGAIAAGQAFSRASVVHRSDFVYNTGRQAVAWTQTVTGDRTVARERHLVDYDDQNRYRSLLVVGSETVTYGAADAARLRARAQALLDAPDAFEETRAAARAVLAELDAGAMADGQVAVAREYDRFRDQIRYNSSGQAMAYRELGTSGVGVVLTETRMEAALYDAAGREAATVARVRHVGQSGAVSIDQTSVVYRHDLAYDAQGRLVNSVEETVNANDGAATTTRLTGVVNDTLGRTISALSVVHRDGPAIRTAYFHEGRELDAAQLAEFLEQHAGTTVAALVADGLLEARAVTVTANATSATARLDTAYYGDTSLAADYTEYASTEGLGADGVVETARGTLMWYDVAGRLQSQLLLTQRAGLGTRQYHLIDLNPADTTPGQRLSAALLTQLMEAHPDLSYAELVAAGYLAVATDPMAIAVQGATYRTDMAYNDLGMLTGQAERSRSDADLGVTTTRQAFTYTTDGRPRTTETTTDYDLLGLEGATTRVTTTYRYDDRGRLLGGVGQGTVDGWDVLTNTTKTQIEQILVNAGGQGRIIASVSRGTARDLDGSTSDLRQVTANQYNAQGILTDTVGFNAREGTDILGNWTKRQFLNIYDVINGDARLAVSRGIAGVEPAGPGEEAPPREIPASERVLGAAPIPTGLLDPKYQRFELSLSLPAGVKVFEYKDGTTRVGLVIEIPGDRIVLTALPGTSGISDTTPIVVEGTVITQGSVRYQIDAVAGTIIRARKEAAAPTDPAAAPVWKDEERITIPSTNHVTYETYKDATPLK